MDYCVFVRVSNFTRSMSDDHFTLIFQLAEYNYLPSDDSFSRERTAMRIFQQSLYDVVPPPSTLRASLSDMMSHIEPSDQPEPPILSIPLTQETRLYFPENYEQTVTYDAVVSKIFEAVRAVESDPPCLTVLVNIDKMILFADERERQVLMRSFEDARVVRAAPAMRSAVEALERRQVSDQDFCCMICLDVVSEGTRVDVTVMPCSQSHMFHSDCILEWLSQNHTCPLCRFKFPKEE